MQQASGCPPRGPSRREEGGAALLRPARICPGVSRRSSQTSSDDAGHVPEGQPKKAAAVNLRTEPLTLLRIRPAVKRRRRRVAPSRAALLHSPPLSKR